jgi:hypothetical protein
MFASSQRHLSRHERAESPSSRETDRVSSREVEGGLGLPGSRAISRCWLRAHVGRISCVVWREQGLLAEKEAPRATRRRASTQRRALRAQASGLHCVPYQSPYGSGPPLSPGARCATPTSRCDPNELGRVKIGLAWVTTEDAEDKAVQPATSHTFKIYRLVRH